MREYTYFAQEVLYKAGVHNTSVLLAFLACGLLPGGAWKLKMVSAESPRLSATLGGWGDGLATTVKKLSYVVNELSPVVKT